jgi:hypothetical protein
MGIKKKRQGPMPNLNLERWQTLALDPNRQSEARAEYRSVHRNASLVEAGRAVTAFARDHKKKWG